MTAPALLAGFAIASACVSHAQDSAGAAGVPSGVPVEIVAEKAIASAADTVLPPAPIEVTVPTAHHAWARFPIGSWRTVRTATETFDERGELVLQSETLHTDTLTEVTDQTYTIVTTSVVDLGGKRLRGATKTTTRSLLSEHCESPPLVTALPPADISLSGRAIPCQRWELSIGQGAFRRLETVFYSAEVSPYFLRRELSAADGTSSGDITTQVSSLVSLELPILIEGGMISGRQVLTQSTSGANTTERIELACDEAPGGVGPGDRDRARRNRTEGTLGRFRTGRFRHRGQYT